MAPAEFWQKVFPFMDGNAYKTDIEAAYDSPPKLNNEMYTLAKNLSKKFQVYCLSNSNFLQGKANRKHGLYRVFSGLFLSHEMHEAKPSPSAYRKLLKETGLKAGECLFIDDARRNIAMARLLGFRAFRFKNAEGLENKLKMGIFN